MKENNFEIRSEVTRLKMKSDASRQDEEAQATDEGKLWSFFDSPIEQYDLNFREVLPAGIQTLSEYVEKRYGPRKGTLVGVELGGPGAKLFGGMPKDYFQRSAGFTLAEDASVSDAPKTHEILEADVFNRRQKDDKFPGYQRIEGWVKSHGRVDLLIERMVAPIENTQEFESSNHLMLILKRWYKLLNDGGTAFIELPQSWSYAENIQRFLLQHKDIFDSQMHEKKFSNRAEGEIDGIYLRLRKLRGAPESLDTLLINEK